MSATAYGHARPGWFAGRRAHPAPRQDDGPQRRAETSGRAHVGRLGETVRLEVRVERIVAGENGMRTYLVRDLGSGNLLEWSSARRYGIFVGEHMRLTGVVAAHVHRDGQCLTRLRHCFNPMRLS